MGGHEVRRYPDWELGVQIVPEADEYKVEFVLPGATKYYPKKDRTANTNTFIKAIAQHRFVPEKTGEITCLISFNNPAF